MTVAQYCAEFLSLPFPPSDAQVTQHTLHHLREEKDTVS